MHVRYDQEADAVYVGLRSAEGHMRSRRLDEQRVLDYDEHGALVGVEFLFVSRGLRVDGLPESDRIADLLRSFPQPAPA